MKSDCFLRIWVLKTFLLLFLNLTIQVNTRAQGSAPAIQWQKCLEGLMSLGAVSVKQTKDLGFVIAGINSDYNNGRYGSLDVVIVKLSRTGQIEWSKKFGGSGTDNVYDLELTPDNGYIFVGTSDSNDGDATGNHGNRDVWIVKLDNKGILQWKKSLGGAMADEGKAIEVTAGGEYLVAAQTRSNNADVSGNHNPNTADAWVIKLNNTGNVLWTKCFGGSFDESCNDIKFMQDGNFLAIGYTFSNDGDVSGNHSSNTDGWLFKIDSSGGLLQQKCFGGSRTEKFRSADKTSDGFIVCGETYSLDGDVSGFHDVPNPREADTWIVNINNNLELLWQKCLGGTGIEQPRFVKKTQSNEFIVGSSASSNNGDVIGKHPTASDAWIVKLSATGSIIWSRCYGGNYDESFTDCSLINDDEYFFVGRTGSSMNGDVSCNAPNGTSWVVKAGKINHIKGNVFVDVNQNGIKDVTEKAYNYGLIEIFKTGVYKQSNVINGQFNIETDTGSYNTSFNQASPYYSVLPAQVSSNFTTYLQTDSINFRVIPVPGKKDYSLTIFALSPARPGFITTSIIKCENIGTDTLLNKKVRLVKDFRLNVVSINPAPTTIINDTITWDISSLLPQDSTFIVLQLALSSTTVIGNTISSYAIIDSTNDLVPANNKAFLRQRVTGSYDPNDKQDSRNGIFYKDEYDANRYLIYTIRFQNTGTDTAFNITIRDTLSSALNSSSLEMVSSSHPYRLEIKNGRQCSWIFDNILLPDSSTNQLLSNGYLVYRIKAMPGLNLGNAIANSASIYFDFNAPIKTNTHNSIISIPVVPPPQPILSGLNSEYCKSLGNQKGKIINIPIADNLRAIARLDGTLLKIESDSSISFDTNLLLTGQHLIEIVFSNDAGLKTSNFTFNINNLELPKTSLSSSSSIINNKHDSIVITAKAEMGGGAKPLFLFAKDRNMVNQLKSRNNNNELQLSASMLTEGDNHIYVQMETSAPCYVSKYTIDSILIVRKGIIGITDPDDPGQNIGVYPNPTFGPLKLVGLNPAKAYSIRLITNNGKLIFSSRVKSSREVILNLPVNSSGGYLLNIYDESKKRHIGTIPLQRR